MEHKIAQIRAMILDGKTDAQIQLKLLDDERDTGIQSWQSPRATFRSLAGTMRRKVDEGCAVGVTELIPLLDLFRTFWEEIVASGDLTTANELAYKILSEVCAGDSVSAIYQSLREDADEFLRPQPKTPTETARRDEVGMRHRKVVDGIPVICVGRVAEAVARTNLVLFTVLGQAPQYQALFTPDVLQPLVPVLIMPSERWCDIVKTYRRRTGNLKLVPCHTA